MKKIVLMVVALMMATVSAHAENDRNEISIAYGGGANTDLIVSLYKGMFTGKQLDYWGPISLEYFYRPSERLGVGAVAAIGGCKWDDSNDAKTVFYTIMPAVKYSWVKKAHFGMYSKAAVGLTVCSDDGVKKEKESSTTVNFQITGIGVEFGGAIRGFAELGMGEQGIILGGLRYKF